jgi:glutathione S-transferase
VIRLSRILTSRGWNYLGAPQMQSSRRWQAWVEALERNPHVVATTSSAELYAETVDLLAQNSPTMR